MKPIFHSVLCVLLLLASLGDSRPLRAQKRNTITVNGANSQHLTVENRVGNPNPRNEDKIDVSNPEVELFIIEHDANGAIIEYKMRLRAIIEYTDVGTSNNGYTSGDTVVRTWQFTGQTYGNVVLSSGTHYTLGTSSGHFAFGIDVDTTSTTLTHVLNVELATFRYSSYRQSSTSKIAFQTELVGIKKNAGGSNIEFPELTDPSGVVAGFGNAVGSATLTDGTPVTVSLTYSVLTSGGSTDKKWDGYFSFLGGAGTAADFNNIKLWNSFSTGLTTSPLTTSPLTTSPLTTSALTTGNFCGNLVTLRNQLLEEIQVIETENSQCF